MSSPSWGKLWRGRARVVEAMVLLAAGGFAQKRLPMVRWSWLLGQPTTAPSEWQGRRIDDLVSRAATPVEARVAGAVRQGSHRLPWEPTCLAQAVAAQIMLRQRREPGVVVIGLRQPSVASRRWDAHAWVLGGRGALTGGPAAAGFTATTVFEVPGGLSAESVQLPGTPTASRADPAL